MRDTPPSGSYNSYRILSYGLLVEVAAVSAAAAGRFGDSNNNEGTDTDAATLEKKARRLAAFTVDAVDVEAVTVSP